MADTKFSEAFANRGAGFQLDGSEILGAAAGSNTSGNANSEVGFTVEEIRAYANSPVLTVGPNGQFATIADAIASLSSGVPIDVTVPATTVSIANTASNYYAIFNGITDLTGTDYLSYPRWLKPQDTGGLTPYMALSKEGTGQNTGISMYCAMANYAPGQDNMDYTVVDFPKITIELDSTVSHEITTDVTLPERWNMQIRGDIDRANITTTGAGVLRFMDEGAVSLQNIDFMPNVLSGLNLTNKAASQYARSSLFIRMNNTIIRCTGSSLGGTSILKNQLVNVDCASIKWSGGFYANTPDPATLILCRFFAAEFIAAIILNSVQDSGNRHVGVEFGFYDVIHRAIMQKSITVRSSVISSTIHASLRDKDTDLYTTSSITPTTGGTGISVFFANTGRVIAHGTSGMTAFGGTLATYMEDGATVCKMMTPNPQIESNALFTGLGFANAIAVGVDGTGFYTDGSNTIVPLSGVHKVQIVGSPVTVTATPSMSDASFIEGQRLVLQVDDAGGSNALTLQDESILPGSKIVTKSGLTAAGQLVVSAQEFVEFVYFNGRFIQISDVQSFESNPYAA